MLKEKIRHKVLSLIQQIPIDARQNRDKSMGLFLDQWVQSYEQVAAYVPMKHEIAFTLSVNQLFLPRLKGNEMCFETAQGESLDMNKKTLMLVPGIAFNQQGFRIGMGKGFFDRFLVSKPNIVTVGVLYKEQLVDFEPKVHDIPLSTLCVVDDQTVNIIQIEKTF